MHSSRMHTAHFSAHLEGRVSVWGWGVSARRGCLARGGVCLGGVCLGSVCPLNRITDRCKNITFPQLRFRAVIKEIGPWGHLSSAPWIRQWRFILTLQLHLRVVRQSVRTDGHSSSAPLSRFPGSFCFH